MSFNRLRLVTQKVTRDSMPACYGTEYTYICEVVVVVGRMI